ncbi:MAG: hypothetical protein ABMA64_13560, partial [Myxococcota bacterium]
AWVVLPVDGPHGSVASRVAGPPSPGPRDAAVVRSGPGRPPAPPPPPPGARGSSARGSSGWVARATDGATGATGETAGTGETGGAGATACASAPGSGWWVALALVWRRRSS